MEDLKIRKSGNSFAVNLPKAVRDRLQVTEGSTVYLIEEKHGYWLTSYDPEFDEEMQLLEEGMTEYRDTLRRLAE